MRLQTKNKNSNHSGSIGVGFNVGGQQNGFTINLGASMGRGRMDGEDTWHTHSQLNALERLHIVSGTNSTLKGASVFADRIDMDTRIPHTGHAC